MNLKQTEGGEVTQISISSEEEEMLGICLNDIFEEKVDEPLEPTLLK